VEHVTAPMHARQYGMGLRMIVVVMLAGCAANAPGGGSVIPGVDVLLNERAGELAGARLGLITNHTGLTSDGRSTIDALHAHPGLNLVALFSPEHGIRGTADARVAHGVDEHTGLPIHSLYSETREPTAAMLADVDALLFDIQDIGARYYTYVWTMALALRAAAEHGKRFIVLDRPNPLGGEQVQGNVLDPAFATFVGLYPVPMRHGLTAGELARLINAEDIGGALDVVAMRGWTRAQYYDQTGLAWHAPSPNMPSLESALHYPGTCLFEGTNLSVGRGTPIAFQQIGAPWLAADRIAARLQERRLPGVRIEAVRFTPASPGDGKYDGVALAGLRFTATDRSTYDPTLTAIATLVEIHALHGDSLQFREAHFDRLAGTSRVRLAVLAGEAVEELTREWEREVATFRARRQPYLIYR
jgi:uncharacterized protein YbbC (DUF1343 family)